MTLLAPIDRVLLNITSYQPMVVESNPFGIAALSINDRIKSREEFQASFKASIDVDFKQAGCDDFGATWHSVRMFTKTIASQYA